MPHLQENMDIAGKKGTYNRFCKQSYAPFYVIQYNRAAVSD